MGENLICPYCGREQYTHEPDDISADMCLTECEHCRRNFWYSVEVTREYSPRRDTENDRYQVITYDRDGGADEKLEYQTIEEAERAAQGYTDGTEPLSDGLCYEGAMVYDLKERRVVREFGYFPNFARPTERRLT